MTQPATITSGCPDDEPSATTFLAGFETTETELRASPTNHQKEERRRQELGCTKNGGHMNDSPPLPLSVEKRTN
uniref:Uncharacterized protein n=1 Tax=Oryza brachyantha TaxID=4533 RepID=J3LN55_ORYBR